MKISIDAGALCTKHDKRFGNYVMTRNLLEMINLYEKRNTYYLYSFCPKPLWLYTGKNFIYQLLRPKTFWLSTRVSLEELRFKKNIFLALNQAIPLKTQSTIIAFSHGLSFWFYPQLYPDSYYAMKDQLKPMVQKSKAIIVSSIRVKREMENIFPTYRHFVVLNYGVPVDMLSYENKNRKKYFLFVGMNHLIKNIDFLVKSFKELRKDKKYSEYKLYLVGDLNRYDNRADNIFAFNNVHRDTLRQMYQEATALLAASWYESFNIPVLEALSQNCQVVGLESAIIPELKKYVHIVKKTEQFVEVLKEIVGGKTKEIDVKKIREQFSWKKYIVKLTSLYQ